jgi:hypothetical protein
MIQKWSLDRLTCFPHINGGNNQFLRELVQDVALRLDRQNSIIESLQDVLTDSRDKENQLLDRANKALRDFKYLHKDTHRKASLLITPMQIQKENFNPLLLQHIHKTLEEIHVRHSLTMESLAEMVIHVRPLLQDFSSTRTTAEDDWNTGIMTLLQSKVGLQLLADHGSLLSKQVAGVSKNKKMSKKGAISIETAVFDIIEQARAEAKNLCEAHYLTSPHVISLKSNNDCEQPRVTCVRPWIHYVLVELLKNSMAITAQRKKTSSSASISKHYYEDEDDEQFRLNPIYVRVEESPYDIQIQILDQGGGTSHNDLPNFSFCQTQQVWDRMDDQQTYAMTRSPLQGLGVGLCMSDLYLQHFGGDLKLINRPFSPSDDLEKGMTATLFIPKDTGLLERGLEEVLTF